jgi:hypothetical protein
MDLGCTRGIAVLLTGLVAAGCSADRYSCLDDWCQGPGVALRVWVDSADWRMHEVRAFDVTSPTDRAAFDSQLAGGAAIPSTPVLGQPESTPFCQDFSKISLIHADLPDEVAGKTAAIAAYVTSKHCTDVLGRCVPALAGFVIRTLTDGCQTVMIPIDPATPPRSTFALVSN